MKEQELIALLQQPETRNKAFDQVVRTYQRPLYYHIRRMLNDHEDTDDALQNTFVAAWRYIDKFRADSSLKTWLYKIATNETLALINQKNKRQSASMDGIENAVSHSTGQQSPVEGEAILEKLQQAIATLPEKQRLVFNMRYYDEMSFKEISEVLEVSEGGLKANYHHAVKKIEAYITGLSESF